MAEGSGPAIWRLLPHSQQSPTFRPSTDRRPEIMHSFRPVPSTIASYSSSMTACRAPLLSLTDLRVSGARSERHRGCAGGLDPPMQACCAVCAKLGGPWRSPALPFNLQTTGTRQTARRAGRGGAAGLRTPHDRPFPNSTCASPAPHQAPPALLHVLQQPWQRL